MVFKRESSLTLEIFRQRIQFVLETNKIIILFRIKLICRGKYLTQNFPNRNNNCISPNSIIRQQFLLKTNVMIKRISPNTHSKSNGMRCNLRQVSIILLKISNLFKRLLWHRKTTKLAHTSSAEAILLCLKHQRKCWKKSWKFIKLRTLNWSQTWEILNRESRFYKRKKGQEITLWAQIKPEKTCLQVSKILMSEMFLNH